jgi:hypothetical protein
VSDAIETRVVLAARDSLRQASPPSTVVDMRVQIGPGMQPPSPLTAPTLLVHDAEGTLAERIIHYPPTWEHRIRFAVNCWAIGPGEDGRLRELLNLTSVVRRRLLREDRRLGGLLDSDVIEVEPDDTDEATAGTVGTARLDFMARVTIEAED